jgi:FAD/FMN-containing dehydrogenase
MESIKRPARREVLRWGAGAVAAVSAAGCAARKAEATAATLAAPTPGPAASGADWTALARDLAGTLVRPGDGQYAAAGRLFQPQYDTLRPAGVAYVASAHDVATCLAFARRYRVPVVARSGGHSYAGWSGNNGLVVDVGRLSGVTGGGGSATVGAGARLIDVYSGLAAHGTTIPAGSCPTVGVAGLTLGGGVGVTGRAYGLTCDSLTSAQIVTADGTVRTVDASRDPDLFWALRGGGGGNFGVVTSLTFRTHPAADCAYAFVTWPWSRAQAVVRAWQQWAPSAPDALWSALHLDATAGGSPRVMVVANLLGTVGTLENELSALTARVGAQPASSVVHSRAYLDTMKVMGGVLGWTQAQAHLPGSLPGQNPAGRVTRESYAARSDIYTRAIPDTGIAALVAAVERYVGAGPAGGSASVAFDALGGAINRVAPGATAFVHRGGLFQAQYIANYPGHGIPSGDAVSRSRGWLNGTWQGMRRYASGEAYQNYIDPQLTDWARAYYGANLGRLSAVKRTYDPGRLFTFPQAVPS